MKTYRYASVSSSYSIFWHPPSWISTGASVVQDNTIQHSSPLWVQMFNYNYKQQMALLSFNFFACDWALDCIHPKTKGRTKSFCFLTEAFIVCEQTRPIQHLKWSARCWVGWSNKWLPSGMWLTQVTLQFAVDVQVKVMMSDWRKHFPPWLCCAEISDAVRGSEIIQANAARWLKDSQFKRHECSSLAHN